MHENANKFSFIAHAYPEHKLSDVLALLQLPSIDLNAAVWVSVDNGWIGQPALDGTFERLEKPEKWAFGDSVLQIQSLLEYCLVKLAEKESDIEEYTLSEWASGHASHDLLIALQLLLNDGIIATYSLKDYVYNEDGSKMVDEEGKTIPSDYTFYTLFNNRKHQWGKKQFNITPTENVTNE